MRTRSPQQTYSHFSMHYTIKFWTCFTALCFIAGVQMESSALRSRTRLSGFQTAKPLAACIVTKQSSASSTDGYSFSSSKPNHNLKFCAVAAMLLLLLLFLSTTVASAASSSATDAPTSVGFSRSSRQNHFVFVQRVTINFQQVPVLATMRVKTSR